MSTFSASVDAALTNNIQCLICGAIEILLPGTTIRLVDGAATIKFPDGRVFVGLDATHGAISSIDSLTDGVGDEAPALRLTLNPASNTAAADLAAAAMQNSKITFWLLLINAATGQVIGSPDDQMLFLGLLDVPTLKKTAVGRVLEYEVTSYFEPLFITDDGIRLTNAFHITIWPNDNGLEFMTSVPRQLNWGSNATHDGVDKSPKLGTTRGR